MNVAAKLCMVFLGVMASSGLCFGETIYVDQSGGGDYTTIADGINAAYPDDTIKVAPGTYNVTVNINRNIKLVGSGPKYTVINASLNGIEVASGITTEIRGFTIMAGGIGIVLNYGSISTIENNIISGCGSHGIYYYTNNSASSYAITTTIRNNTVVFNSDSGISLHQYGANYSSCNIMGNIVAYNGEDGIYLYLKTENLSCNNVYANTTNYDNCTVGAGDVSLNPYFMDQAAGNYALQSTSPSIDKGIPGEPYNDPDGTRNDMGAYSGPNAAAFWPYVPRGPVVTEVDLTPASVPRGGTLTIRANGRVQ